MLDSIRQLTRTQLITLAVLGLALTLLARWNSAQQLKQTYCAQPDDSSVVCRMINTECRMINTERQGPEHDVTDGS